MNICYLSVENPVVGRGGVDTVAVVLTRGFESRGDKVFHVAWQRNVRSGDETFGKNLPCEFLPDAKHFGAKENADFFQKKLVKNRIDAVIYSCGIGKKYPFSQVTRSLGVPVAADFHSQPNYYRFRYGFFERIRRRFSQRAKYRWNFDACDALVLLSDGLRCQLVQHLRSEQAKRSREKIFAIGNPAPFPPQTVEFSQKKKEILMVGIGWSAKRPYLLLRAWKKLEARFPEWSVRFLGGGYDLKKLRVFAEKLGLRRAFFEGFQNPEKYYREASIFCMTSAYEGFPMVLVESAAFGCVPVAFDSFAAVRDIISDGENGVLVPAFDLDAYAEKLAQLMSDDALRERLAQTALSKIPEKFSPQKIVQKWIALFDSCNGSAKPKFSVITVCRNAAKTIEQTIRSVVAQTYKNKEFIVIDGASTDGTREILSRHQSEIDVLVSEPDKGIYDAMNKGILRATGDYLIFINADDLLYAPETLEKIAALNPTADLILGDQVNVFAGGREEFQARGGVDVYRIVYLGAVFHQATFFKKTLFDKFGLYDTKYKIAADGDFVAKAFLNGASWQKTSEIIAKFSCMGISWNSTDAEHWSVVGKYLGNPLPMSIHALKRIEKIFRGILGKDDFSPSSLRKIWIFFMNKACERAVARKKRAVEQKKN